MARFIRSLLPLFALLLSPLFAWVARANTINASTCSSAAVQAAVNSASNGDTVVIPNGSCTWTSGVTVNKQITLTGESVGGVTIINASSGDLLTITIGNSFHTIIANLRFLPGTATNTSDYLVINGTGLVPLMHDMYFNLFQFQMFHAVEWDVTGGVIWNTTFESTDPTNAGTGGCLVVKPNIPWDTPSTMGTLDTQGTSNLYIEDSTFNLVDQCPDIDDNGRVVLRHVTYNGASGLTHGATSAEGGRFVEFYNSALTYPQLVPARNMNRYFWWRAGTGVVTGNTIQWINGASYPNKPTWAFSAENAQRAANKGCCVGYMCWHQAGSGSDGLVHSPMNTPPTVNPSGGGPVALGQDSKQIADPIYIWNNTGTGSGLAHLAGGFIDGSPESPSDFCNTSVVPVNPATGQEWSTVDLVLKGRDILLCDTTDGCSGGAKPGWAPYTYPHPLRALVTGGGGPTAPSGLSATVQ